MAFALLTEGFCPPTDEHHMRETLILAYAAAVGFAASGATSTLLQTFTRRPVAFSVPEGGAGRLLIALLSFMVTGPYIVARATFRMAAKRGKSFGLVGGGLAIAMLWSACSGIAILGLLLSLQAS